MSKNERNVAQKVVDKVEDVYTIVETKFEKSYPNSNLGHVVIYIIAISVCAPPLLRLFGIL